MQKSIWYTRPRALRNIRERHNRKILFAVSVEEYASHLLVSKVTAGLMTDNNKPKSANGHASLTSRQPPCICIISSIEKRLILNQMRWVVRMGDESGYHKFNINNHTCMINFFFKKSCTLFEVQSGL